MPSLSPALMALQQRLGHAFAEPALLQRAVTHKSFGADHYERLEFLGDAVLELGVSTLLYARFAQGAEGDLTRVRAHLVRQDMLHRLAVLLGLPEVLRLSEGRGPGGGPECEPALSSNGAALLTASELLWPGRPALRFERPDAELVGASFLSDSTVLVVYAPGKSHPIRFADGLVGYGRTPTVQQLRAPNAFVRNIRTGRVVRRFHYHGFYEEMGYTIPGFQLRATATQYLLDEKRGLYLLPLGGTGVPVEMGFAAMPRFVPPKRLAEVRFEINSAETTFAFYVDTSSVQPRIRYQRLAE